MAFKEFEFRVYPHLDLWFIVFVFQKDPQYGCG